MKVFQFIAQQLLSQDRYGHIIGVHYNGEDSYKTKLGAFCSIGVYALMFSNFVALLNMYGNGDRQEDKYSYEIYERWKSDEYNLAENGIELTLFPYDRSSEKTEFSRIGKYKLEQILPGDKKRTVYLSDCTAEKKKEINAYYAGNGEYFEQVVQTAQCIFDDKIYLQGENVFTKTFAGVAISFESCNDLKP